MSLVGFFSQPVWHRLGLTLVHFSWQGLAVAVITCATVQFVRLKRGNPRYAAYLLAFAVMAEKGLLSAEPKGRAFLYSAKISQAWTQSEIVRDLLSRVFDGSASALVTHLLEQAKPDSEELHEIRKTIAEFARKKGGA